MENTDKITINAQPGELVIRHGAAPEIHDPVQLVIKGQITAPRRYYDARKNLLTALGMPYFALATTHIVVNREKMSICLKHNEHDKFGSIITGELELSAEYKELSINSGSAYTTADLAKKLRNVRYLFENREEGMKLIGALMKFTGTINAQVEAHKDTSGNKRTLHDVAVVSNIPEFILLKIPIFKGQDPTRLKVEINLDTRSNTAVDCYLESPEALQIIHDERNKIIDEQIDPFIQDGITVFEV